MNARGSCAAAALLLASTGCTSILGDFEVGTDATADQSATDAAGSDSSRDATLTGSDAASGAEASSRDAPVPDGNADGAVDAAGCDAGATACPSGCVSLEDASANCGACGRDCHGASCTGGVCGAYVVARQPTTGAVAKLATDGTRVVWADTGIIAVEQIAATGGPAIVLAPASGTYGPITNELAFAGTTVAYAYAGNPTPGLGVAEVDVADSGGPVLQGAVEVNAVSLNRSATHVFYVDITGNQGSLNDCAIAARDAGPCTGVSGGGRFLAQTAADDAYLVYDLTGANVGQAGLYVDTVASETSNIFATDLAASLADDGTWAYWTVANSGDASATFTLKRTLESAPTTVAQTVASSLASAAFATDGANVYYWSGSAVVSKPVAGGPVQTLAPASAFTQIAVGGGLLVWTDGATIWGLVLPG